MTTKDERERAKIVEERSRVGKIYWAYRDVLDDAEEGLRLRFEDIMTYLYKVQDNPHYNESFFNDKCKNLQKAVASWVFVRRLQLDLDLTGENKDDFEKPR